MDFGHSTLHHTLGWPFYPTPAFSEETQKENKKNSNPEKLLAVLTPRRIQAKALDLGNKNKFQPDYRNCLSENEFLRPEEMFILRRKNCGKNLKKEKEKTIKSNKERTFETPSHKSADISWRGEQEEFMHSAVLPHMRCRKQVSRSTAIWLPFRQLLVRPTIIAIQGFSSPRFLVRNFVGELKVNQSRADAIIGDDYYRVLLLLAGQENSPR